jgi:hypothetical protein
MTGWTLGKVKAGFLELEAYCQNDACRHFYALDIDGLIENLGADFALDDVPAVACPDCGGALKLKLAMLDPRGGSGRED